MTTNQGGGSVTAIIPAGGVGSRFGQAQPKQYVTLADWPLLAHTLSRFDQTPWVDRVILVVPYGHKGRVREEILKPFGIQKVTQIVFGGEHRQESVYSGFLALEDDVDLVVIHDAVRPLVRVRTIEEVIDAARTHGAAIAAIPVRDTLKRVEDDNAVETLDRSQLWQAQTPQAFRRDVLAEALAAARRDGVLATDEAALVERLGLPVRIVPGAADNIKITLPEDHLLAESLIGRRPEEETMRVGIGVDVHRLVRGRPLMLGGVAVPYDQGLEGHSDADVIVHALSDALLSAAGLPDIGVLFPDDDPQWAGLPGRDMLARVAEKISEAGFRLINADVSLLAERPKIAAHVPRMVEALAQALDAEPDQVRVKATTTEALGPIGRGEGMAAWAVALLAEKTAP